MQQSKLLLKNLLVILLVMFPVIVFSAARITPKALKDHGPQKLAEMATAEVAKNFLQSPSYKRIQSSPPGDTFLASTKNARLVIYVSRENMLEVISSRSLKNQHQTGYSFQVDSFDPEQRWAIEEGLLGADFSKSLVGHSQFNEFLPKYGIVEFPDFAAYPENRLDKGENVPSSEDPFEKFGEIAIYLKDSVKSRTTFTPRDSGNAMAEAQSFRQEHIFLNFHDINHEYFEIQAWGKISLNDIAFVAFHYSEDNAAIIEALQKKKIPMRLIKTDLSEEEKLTERLRVNILEDTEYDGKKRLPIVKAKDYKLAANEFSKFNGYNSDRINKILQLAVASDQQATDFLIKYFSKIPLNNLDAALLVAHAIKQSQDLGVIAQQLKKIILHHLKNNRSVEYLNNEDFINTLRVTSRQEAIALIKPLSGNSPVRSLETRLIMVADYGTDPEIINAIVDYLGRDNYVDASALFEAIATWPHVTEELLGYLKNSAKYYGENKAFTKIRKKSVLSAQLQCKQLFVK